MPAETETMHAGTSAGAVVSGVAAAMGAVSDAIKQYGSHSSGVADSRRKGGGIGHGGRRGMKRQSRQK